MSFRNSAQRSVRRTVHNNTRKATSRSGHRWQAGCLRRHRRNNQRPTHALLACPQCHSLAQLLVVIESQGTPTTTKHTAQEHAPCHAVPALQLKNSEQLVPSNSSSRKPLAAQDLLAKPPHSMMGSTYVCLHVAVVRTTAPQAHRVKLHPLISDICHAAPAPVKSLTWHPALTVVYTNQPLALEMPPGAPPLRTTAPATALGQPHRARQKTLVSWRAKHC